MNHCPWTIKDVFVVFVYAVALYFVISFWGAALYFLAAFVTGHSRQAPGIYLHFVRQNSDFLTVLLFYGVLLAAVKIKIFNKYRISLLAYFVNREHLLRDISLGVKTYLRFILVFLSGIILVVLAAKVWDIVFGGHALESVNLFFAATEIENVTAQKRQVGLSGFLIVFLLGPFLEEIFFRGCLYRALRRRMNMLYAIVLSSFIFALMHGYFFLFFYVFLVGLVLAYLYEKTEALVAPLSFHMLNNLFVIFLFLLGF
ncbi:MAG: type II CAAX endopeptidase family protein [Candidatus Omnitrophica bacterium]|nr:type II CAAX endopeptidase family protein [Candidatus Omnitrophota bacterium]MDD5573985.1 type II CAAX endopeptidase family protein [Candidatus Omnitrophota bacterium]